MTPSIEFLHLETAFILIFLVMVVATEFSRRADPEYDVLGGIAPLRWLPIAFVLLAVTLTGLLFNTSPLLGFELATGITLSLLHPVNALCFMAHLMYLRPWEIAPDNHVLALMPRLGVSLCIFSWLIHSRRRSGLSWRRDRSVLLLLGFSGWLLLTTLKIPGRAAAVSDWFDTYFKSLAMFGLAFFLIENERSVREVQRTMVISTFALMAAGLYQFFSVGLMSGRLESSGMLGDPNDLGAVIVMALPFALVPVFEKTSSLLTRAAGLIYAGVAAYVIWLTRSRGTMLAVVAELLVVRLVRTKREKLGLVFAAILLAVGYVGLIHVLPRRAGEMEASEDSRITYWQTAVNMAVHNPILGVGFDQYPDNYMSYAVGKVYERGPRTAHSSWFLALGESGFPGFFFFCAFFISVVRIAWRNRSIRPEQLYAVAGYGVAMSFLSHTYSPYYYLLMGLVLASAGVKKSGPKWENRGV